jgi:hypothetical protein
MKTAAILAESNYKQLSVREHIAIAAMQGILSNPELGKQLRDRNDGAKVTGRLVAKLALECADGLIEGLTT